jgi:hypothetical protein
VAEQKAKSLQEVIFTPNPVVIHQSYRAVTRMYPHCKIKLSRLDFHSSFE